MARLKLTAKGVEKVSTTKAQEDFWDTLVPGLHLRVSGTTGRKTWLVRYRANGTQRRVKLGIYAPDSNPDLGLLSLADAREASRPYLAAADAKRDLAREEEVVAQAEEVRQSGSSFEKMAEEVLKARARKGRAGRPTRDSTQRERRRILEKEILPRWKGREAGAITRREVVLLVEGIADRGAQVQANRTLALLRLLFNDAIRRGFPGVETNPAHLVEAPGAEPPRRRYLGKTEIRAVWKATVEETPLIRGVFRLALLTGQRIGSVCAMRWDGIQGEGDTALWRIPAEDFKGGRPHLVPLSPEALRALRELEEDQVSEDQVFPSRAGCKKPHLTNLTKPLDRIRDRSELEHWTAHDFRTTFRTWATRAKEDGGMGIPGNVADAVLGHAENTLGWNRYQGDQELYLLHEKREALNAWGAFVANVVKEG